MAARLLAALASHHRPAIQEIQIHAVVQAVPVVRTRPNRVVRVDGLEAAAVAAADRQEAGGPVLAA